jgi:ribosomal-protein-alanine N-acetyltransferase
MAIEEVSHLQPLSEVEMWVLLARKNVIGVVAELESPITAIAGFCIDSVHPTHLTIVDLAVHPAHRRQGCGFKIVPKLVHKLCIHRKKEIRVGVHEANLGAQKFLYTAGFRTCGVKSEAYEDAYEFVYDLERVLTQC